MAGLRTGIAAAVLVLATLATGAPPATAHPMPHSVVLLDVRGSAVAAELRLPVDDLSLASGIDVRGIDVRETGSAGPVRGYLHAHLRPRAVDGTLWTVHIGDISVTGAEQAAAGPYRELVAQAVLAPPPGGDVRRFVLGYDAVVHRVATHLALVSVRHDWAAGKVGDAAPPIGVVRTETRTMTVAPLPIDLGNPSAWRGFGAMVRLGGHHILHGTDHLLFLFTLLLPALLVASTRRWHGVVGARSAIGRIGRITLAFTAGHSVALALSALSRVDLPPGPVEVLIAASILVSAAHAVRPLFPAREALVAGAFGVGHGLAFSLALAEMDLSTRQLVLSLLGFNLGIELVQLLLVALALPGLLVLARLRVQPVLRVGGALLAAGVALGWLLDRLGTPNPVARAADSAGSHASLLVAGLVLTAVAGGLWAISTADRAVAADGDPEALDRTCAYHRASLHAHGAAMERPLTGQSAAVPYRGRVDCLKWMIG
jgi:hypothetical protein